MPDTELHTVLKNAVNQLSTRLTAELGTFPLPFSLFIPRKSSPTMQPLDTIAPADDLSEVAIVDRAINTVASQLYNIHPALSRLFLLQRPLIHAVAGAFKASIQTQNKKYSNNPTAGALGVAPLFPYAVKPTSTTPSDYILNTFRLSLTANADKYFFGSPTAFYRGNTTVNQTTWLYIAANGLIEVGSTPSIEQIQLISKEKQAISPMVSGTFIDVPINMNYPAYVYPTPAFYIDNQSDGIKLIGRARATKTVEIRPVGLVFYEYEFFPGLTNAV